MDCLKVISNLQQQCYERKSIDNGLSSIEFSDDNKETKSIFQLIKKQLLGVLGDFDDIVKLQRQTLDDSEKQERLRVLMNLSHKSLIKTREQISKLNGKRSGHPSSSNDFDSLCEYFNSLVNIFSTIAPQKNADLETLDIPAANLLSFDLKKQFDYSSTHKRLVMAALINLIDPLVLQLQNTPDQNRYWALFGYLNPNTIPVDKETFRLYSSQLAELSLHLGKEADLIYSDIRKFLNGEALDEAAPLKKFIQSLNTLYVNPAQMMGAIKESSDEKYKSLIATFINKIFETNSTIKLSDAVKSLLILHALRMKHQSETSEYEFEHAQKSNSLVINDRIPSPQTETLRRVLADIKGHITPKSNKNSSVSADTKALSNDVYIVSTIDGLTKEFTQDGIAKSMAKQESAISKFYNHQNYPVIFIKAGIDLERLTKLDQTRSNKELVSILDDIYLATLKYNVINLKNATELIYILGRSFDYNNKERINPRTLVDRLGNWFRSSAV